MTLIRHIMEQCLFNMMEQYLRRMSNYLHMYIESSCQVWDSPEYGC